MLTRDSGVALLWEAQIRWIVPPIRRYLLFYYSKSGVLLCVRDRGLQGKQFSSWVGHDSSEWFVLSLPNLSPSNIEGARFDVIDPSGARSRYPAVGWRVPWRSAAKTLDMQPRTKSPLFPWGWNSEVFENQLMFSIYCPLYVPCNSPAPWAQLDRQTPKGAVSLGKAWPISFPSDVRTPLNCRVGLLHRHWFGMTVLQWHASALWPILKPVGEKSRG